jgi:hypothetical protein
VVKQRLGIASRRLGTRNPAPAIAGLIDRSFDMVLGDPRYRDNMLAPGAMPLEHSFSETSANALRFAMEPLPGATPHARQQEASREVRRLSQEHFGRGALHWFDRRSEPWRGGNVDGSQRFGAWFGAAADEHGLATVKAYYELRPDQLDNLPPNLQQATRVAMACLPGLRPIFTAIACGRRTGRQRVYLYHQGPLRLLDLEPLMHKLGIGHQLPSTLAALGLILGGRFTLPDGTVVIGLRDTRRGMEMKLEILLPGFPDPPRQMHGLIQMHLAQRPDAQRALRHWVQAMTPDEFASPGRISVVGVRVNPQLGPRLTIYFQPVGYNEGRSESPRPGEARRDPYALSA